LSTHAEVRYSRRRRYCDAGHPLVAGLCLHCTMTLQRALRIRRKLARMAKQDPPTHTTWQREDGKKRNLPYLLGDRVDVPEWHPLSGRPS